MSLMEQKIRLFKTLEVQFRIDMKLYFELTVGQWIPMLISLLGRGYEYLIYVIGGIIAGFCPNRSRVRLGLTLILLTVLL
jgi:hypothetical protein